MLKTNTVGRKLYFSVLAVFLVFAVSFIVFQQTREKQYKISTLTLKLRSIFFKWYSIVGYGESGG